MILLLIVMFMDSILRSANVDESEMCEIVVFVFLILFRLNLMSC